MNQQAIQRIFVILGMMAVAVAASFQLARGVNVMSMARFMVLTSPVWLALILHLRPVWVGILIGLAASPGREIPIPLMEVVPLQIMLVFAMMGVLVLNYTMNRDQLWPANAAGRFMLVLAIMAMVWVAIERPGSYRLGAQTAGLSRVVQFVAAFFFFPVAYHEIGRDFKLGKNLKVVLAIGLFGYARSVYRMVLSFGPSIILDRMVMMGFWIFGPFMLAWLMKKSREAPKYTLLADLWTAYILLGGLLASHRSRLLMSVGAIFIMAWAFGRLRRQAQLMLIAFAVMIPLFLARGVPEKMKRAATLFLPLEAVQFEGRQKESELGFRSEFRMQMIQRGLARIREKPLFGRGMAISVDEAWEIAAVSSAGDSYERRQEFLEMGGGYHNMYITLAVYYGVPALLLFLFAMGDSVWKGIKLIRLERNGDPLWHCFYAATLASFYAYLVQFSVNGGPRDMRVMFLYAGVWQGMWLVRRRKARLAAAGPPSATPTSLVAV
jgi:hypothetical protein